MRGATSKWRRGFLTIGNSTLQRAGWGGINYGGGIPFNFFFAANQVVLSVNMNPLDSTADFPYLRRTVTYNNTNWEVLYANLRKSQIQWGVVAKDLRQTGAHVKAWAMLYKALFHAVLMYGCERWVMIDAIMTVLERFHHRVDQRLAGLTARRENGGKW